MKSNGLFGSVASIVGDK